MIMWKMSRRSTRQNRWMGTIAAESGGKSPRYKVRWGVNLMMKNCGNSWHRAGMSMRNVHVVLREGLKKPSMSVVGEAFYPCNNFGG